MVFVLDFFVTGLNNLYKKATSMTLVALYDNVTYTRQYEF